MAIDSNQRQIRQISAKTGLGLKFISKDIFLSQLLKYLETNLDNRFVLKGGTAISRAGYLLNPRFSEDIDFDYFKIEKPREIGKKLFKILNGVEGFDIRTPKFQHKCLRCDAYFINHFGEKDRIRVEVTSNLGEIIGEYEAPKTILQSPFTSGQASLIKTYSKVNLFIRKIKALADRLDGKDVFDLMGMWSSNLPEQLVVKNLKNYIDLQERSGYTLISNALTNLENMILNIRSIANSTNHFIPRSERPEWKIVLADFENILKNLEKKLDY